MSVSPEPVMDDRIVMLLYRLTMDHDGAASRPEIKEFGVWAEPAANTAINNAWLREEADEGVLETTPEGRKALSRALSSRRTVISGGSVPDEGPRVRLIPPRQRGLDQLQRGLVEEDFEPILNAEGYEDVYNPIKLGFPSLMYYRTTEVWGPNQDHLLAGHKIDPRGYPGIYIVTLTLYRQGAQDNPRAVEMDQRVLEGDSHLRLPEGLRGEVDADDEPRLMSVLEKSRDGDVLQFLFVPNRWGRLGKIHTELRAENFEEANRKVRETLMPILYDLSYRYDVPLDVLQVNTVEKTTLTHAVEKVPDHREAVLPEDPFDGGVDYANSPFYTTFAYLYREGMSSSSIAYGFLCFFKIIEGIRKLRNKRAAEGKPHRYDNEKVEGESTKHFAKEFHDKRFGYVIDKMTPLRDRVAHTFLYDDSTDVDDFDTLKQRLELEEKASPFRSQAREIVRVMMHNEYWSSRSGGPRS